jgi:hypothetical protein
MPTRSPHTSTEQAEAEQDVAALLEAYGPGSVVPLPPVDWTFGPGRVAVAEIPVIGPQPLASLHAYAIRGMYALVLGEAESWQRGDHRVYVVMGRIGPREGADQRPRTLVVLRAIVPITRPTVEVV